MADYDPNHMVWVNGNRDAGGTFKRGQQGQAELRQAFDNITRLFQEGSSPAVVLHFHGGLVPAQTGIDIAHRLIHGGNGTAPFALPQAYCLSFIWESMWELIVPFHVDNREHPVRKRQEVLKEMQRRIDQRVQDVRAHTICLKDSGDCGEGEENPRHITGLEEMVRVFYKKLVVEKWARMKDNILKSFSPGNPGHSVLQHLQNLAEQIAPAKPRIILVAQSAGSIYVCRLVEAARELAPDLEFEIILTAPACTMELFKRTVLARQDRIRDLRMFALSDPHEKTDVMMKDIPSLLFDYRSSMLYFVSGALEPSGAMDEPAPDQLSNYEGDTALLGMQRFYRGQFADQRFTDLHPIQEYMVGRVRWSGDPALDGWDSDAIYHAAFESDPKTLASLGHILETGFGPRDGGMA